VSVWFVAIRISGYADEYSVFLRWWDSLSVERERPYLVVVVLELLVADLGGGRGSTFRLQGEVDSLQCVCEAWYR
jgi:hypothetical protein